MRVLFLCTGNSARSQIAEGLMRALAGDRVEVASAGTKPQPAVNPLAVAAMAEAGFDISSHRPKDVAALGGLAFDVVITVCDAAKESCPVMPGARMLHWSFPDPHTPEDFRAVLAGLRRRIELFLNEGAKP